MEQSTHGLTDGAGIFFDGRISTRREVRVTLGKRLLQIDDSAGRLLAEWPYDAIEALVAPDAVLRLGRHGNARLERLEIFDAAFAAAVDARAANVDRSRGAMHANGLRSWG